MTWVEIDEQLCDGCGICALRCDRVFTSSAGEITTDANEETCILCGHCVALCPNDAISHSRLDMNVFSAIEKGANLKTQEFIQFLKERRSHRHFLNRKIKEKQLDMILEAGRWAPTGSNVQNVEIIVYQDPAKIRKISDQVIDYFSWVNGKVQRKIERLEAEGKHNTEDYRFTRRMLGIGERMSQAKAAGRDPIFYNAPLLMIFHSISATSAPKDNAVLVAHTVALTARTLGIESCYIGLVEVAANYYMPLKAELKLPPDHEVFNAMILGYPELEFLKTVDRKPIHIRWE
ncbi:nitroreductase family protein [bacterium]|nr:nitroreductase family protein [bacterium]